MRQFLRGDMVYISDTMPDSMSHFAHGCYAIVDGNYNDLCHGNAKWGLNDYRLFIPSIRGTSSWYRGELLTFKHRFTEAQYNRILRRLKT